MSSVLIIAAHPDDEVLGCGGTIAKHVRNGDVVNVLILAEGITSRNVKRDREDVESELKALAISARKANRILGVSSVILEEFPDNRMDGLERLDIIKVIENYLQVFDPEIIYTHHHGDVNIDHRIIHEAVVTACRPLPQRRVKRLLFFETVSSSEWQVSSAADVFFPNWFVDTTDVLKTKIESLMAYESEMREWPHPRSIQGVEYLGRWRGVCIGSEAAEAFVLGRNIV